MEKITFTGSMEHTVEKNLYDLVDHISSLTSKCVEIVTFLFTNWYPKNDERTASELIDSNRYFLMSAIRGVARAVSVLQRRPKKDLMGKVAKVAYAEKNWWHVTLENGYQFSYKGRPENPPFAVGQTIEFEDED